MQAKRKRWRWTIASTMIGIAGCSLVLMFFLPVLRQGMPTCMTTYTTIRWLANEPGRASCASCHGNARLVANSDSFLQHKLTVKPAIKPPATTRPVPWDLATTTPQCPDEGVPTRASCLTCHAK